LFYQLTFQVLPSLKGLSCSQFHAVITAEPNFEQGVAFEAATGAEAQALAARLETHFAPRRFSNGAAAFESVKEYVLSRSKAFREQPE
jgi:hypothetical protein